MSLSRLVIGLFAYFALLGALALSMALAAKATAYVVGVREFRWFRELQAPTDWWRLLAVRAMAAVAPFGLAIVISTVGYLANGNPVPTTRVEVLPGPAQEAGMLTNDRVVSIGRESITDWDQLRTTVQRQAGPTPIVVERNGTKLELTVTPRKHRISVAPLYDTEEMPLGTALARGSALPFTVIASTLDHFARVARGRDRANFSGPISIVNEAGASKTRGALVGFVAVLAAYLWPFLVGIPFFDALVSWAFRSIHPAAAGSALRGYRLERLRLGLLLAASGYLTFVLAAGLVGVGLPIALVLLLWSMPCAMATFSLIFIIGSELWSRPVTLLVLGVSLVVPGAALLAALVLLRQLYVALRNEGFRTGILVSRGPSAQK